MVKSAKERGKRGREATVQAVCAWAWTMEGGLCSWAEPTELQLERGVKPSDEACAVRVRIITEADWQRLKTGAAR